MGAEPSHPSSLCWHPPGASENGINGVISCSESAAGPIPEAGQLLGQLSPPWPTPLIKDQVHTLALHADGLYQSYFTAEKHRGAQQQSPSTVCNICSFFCQMFTHRKNILSLSSLPPAPPQPEKTPEKQTETFYHIFFQFRPGGNQKFPLAKFCKPTVYKSLSVS